jgi:hypothetical protein
LTPDPELAAAIEAFRHHPEARRCETPEGARSQCDQVNVLFAPYCWTRGLDARVVWFTGPGRHAFKPYCLLVVTWAAGWFVDWSVRQYDPASPLPRLFTDPHPRIPGFPWPGRLACDLPDRAALVAGGLDPIIRPPADPAQRRLFAELQRRRRAALAEAPSLRVER